MYFYFVDYILGRTGIDKYTCELGAPQPFQLFHGALEHAGAPENF
jgi:hypothetical protein